MALILNGFASIMNIPCLLFICAGTAIGIVFGAIPGLTGTMALSLCLSMTFGMGTTEAFCLLLGLYIGGISGGLISAILLKIPGTPSSIATTFDGYPMAARGEAGKALGTALLYSFLGGLVSILILMFLAPVIAGIALKFGPQEYFAVGIFSLTMLSVMAGKNISKSVASCVMGMFFACVGSAPIDNMSRYTFGVSGLRSGFALLPVMIGLFAISELMMAAHNGVDDLKDAEVRTYSFHGFGVSLKEFFGNFFNFIRSTFIGVGIGILPGIGGGTANVIAYSVAQAQSRHPEKFGTGIVDGIIASETSNNASVGGAMVPLLTLGIPGDTVTALLLAAMTIKGLAPGPLLFTTHADMVYTIFAILLLAHVAMLLIQYFCMKGFVKLLKIPRYILIPVVVLLCVVGAYGNNNRIFDVGCVLFFGFTGYLLNRYEFGLSPFILGFILCPIVEQNLRKGLSYSAGNWLSFFTRPISALFLGMAILVIALSVVKRIQAKQKAA